MKTEEGSELNKIGIFGGSFNPPHIGHIAAARQARQLLGLDKVLLIPTRIAPHKDLSEDSCSAEHRLAMVQLAAAGEEGLEVSDLELRRKGVSYTYETLLELKKQYPDSKFTLLLGSDVFASLDRWKETNSILQNADVAVLCRGEKGEQEAVAAQKEKIESLGGSVVILQNEAVSISSTDVRRLLAFRAATTVLPAGVESYIRKNGLYHTGEDYRNLPMDRLEKVVVSLLNPNRVRHVLGCRDTAVELARRWGENEVDAARAGILHDITKALDGPLQLTLCAEYGMMLDEFGAKNPKTLHALTGSLVARRIFGENENVVRAICWHTTGRGGMSTLEKIIYIADYMEPNRDFPGVEELRKAAFTDLNASVRMGIEMTIAQLKKRNSTVSPESAEALRDLGGSISEIL